MSRLIVYAFACGAAFFIVGCQNNYEMPPSHPSPTAVTDSNLRIAFQISPRQIRQMDPAALTVRLSNAQSEPVTGAAVLADLAMPAMDMGKNTVTLKPVAKGTYTGTCRFTMDGNWVVTVTATKGQGKTVQSYPVSVQ